MGKGYLKIEVFAGDHAVPEKNIQIFVRDENGKLLHTLTTNESGYTDTVELAAPDKRFSLDPFNTAPVFSIVDVEIPAQQGFKKTTIHGVQIFDTETSILPVQLHPAIQGDTVRMNTEDIFIPMEHGVTNTFEFPAQSAFDSLNQPIAEPAARALANEVRIPDYITVHLGSPNAAAQNVRVPFIDYIKNVASSEIFPTWNEAALYANIYCQISFALNRIYTVWYRSRGYEFDITNSTSFDQAFVYGRNIFANISQIVDGIFNQFLRRPGRREPFFAQYCNGTTVTCPGLSQWGSQDLAVRGYTPIEIIRYYFPKDMQIVESNNFSADVGTFPGTPLKEGSSGEGVRRMQNYLNRISANYPLIPQISNPNGTFGSSTRAATAVFQPIANLIADGIIGKKTWYAITKFYVGIKRLAELDSEGERISVGLVPPTVVLQVGSRGEYVVELQFLLNYISTFFPTIPFVIEDSVFRESTKRAVIEFQKEFGLTPDGIVGPTTWKKLYDVYHSIKGAVTPTPPDSTIPQFPGTPLRIGSTGAEVRFMQGYLNEISSFYPSIPGLTVDGIFGNQTYTSVVAFQRHFGLTPDGIIGEQTWNRIVEVYDSLPGTATPQFPGTPLRIGSRGDSVKLMQTYLNAIAKVFPVIPTLTADGIFGANTQTAVITFQWLFNLTPDGVIGEKTWNEIVSAFDTLPEVAAPQYPGTALRLGSRGNNVTLMQKYLNTIAPHYPSIPALTADGIFGPATERSVIAFQKQFGLIPDGVIGRATWNQIVSIYNLINMNMPG